MTDISRAIPARSLVEPADLSLPPDKRYRLVAWLSLIGVLLPPRELSIQAGVNLTPGRICVFLLLAPALSTLLSGGPRLRWPDVFALATAGWIVVASVSVKGTDALFSAAGAESLEFLGAYMIGRAFLGGAAALREFLRVLQIVTLVLLVFSFADRISGQWIVENTFAALTHTVPAGANYREGVVRATATLDHPILLGSFFALASGLLVFSNGRPLQRGSSVVANLFGCLLSLSSASVMAWSMTIGAFAYETMLRALPWRWNVFWAAIVALLGAVFMVANAPLGWVITHLTWDPASAYYRYLIWDQALARIAVSPIFGYDFSHFNDSILDASVDCVWLAYALRFGVPMIAFLFLTNLTAAWPSQRITDEQSDDRALLSSMSTGFTVVLVMFMFIGLTVHFWNFMWIFWGLCLGAKVSIKQTLSQPAQ